MPVVRYLVFVGALLLLLLFAADHYFPRNSEASAVAEVDRSVIRIRSARPLPEKIVFDVSRSPVPALSVAAVVEHDDPSPREALAMVPQDQSVGTQPVRAVTERASIERAGRHQRAVRASRAAHRMFERRVAFEHREFFGGW